MMSIELRGRRIGWRAALTIGGVAVMGFVATGCSSDVCAGIATCFDSQASRCQRVPGCAPTSGCMVDPIYGPDCPSATTEAACLAILAVTRCAWSKGACTGPCSDAKDQVACQSMLGCNWSACTGRPKPCDSYSADSCPTTPLGCYVTTDSKGVIGE